MEPTKRAHAPADAAEITTQVTTREEDSSLVRESDLAWVVAVLVVQRDEILARWLEATADQPFHQSRRDQAIADHIPRLFDSVVDLLRRGSARWVDPGTPLDDPMVASSARSHARARAEQGLQPVDVVVEFRLLRHEIWRALRLHLPDNVPTGDVVGAQILINDAIDGAISVGLQEIMDRIEVVREDFLATTMHEVRQPITAIKGAAQVSVRQATEAEPDMERIAGSFHRIESEIDRMSVLLDRLVDSSRVALGYLELQVTALDIENLLRRTISHLGPEASERIQITIEGRGRTTGSWDPIRMEQLLGNLLSNAMKYSPPDTPVEVAILTHEETIEISVRDHGIGLEHDEQARLFQRYARGRGAVEEGIDGLGLGLYLCRRIVEAHGGRIWAASDGRGQGTTLHVILPRAAHTDGDHTGEVDATSDE